ncbi:MAG TPA: hypothetical protein VGS80_27465 [Ktedonobacterales bacterium]|nr:hypothetical protein [Ktedonobacterales bacterium]
MSQHPPGRGEGRTLPPKEARGPNPVSLTNQHQQRQRPTTTPVILSLVPSRRRVKREAINGESVKIMAGMVWCDLERFRPASALEAAVARSAYVRAKAIYHDAQRLAAEVNWLNALVAEADEGGLGA